MDQAKIFGLLSVGLIRLLLEKDFLVTVLACSLFEGPLQTVPAEWTPFPYWRTGPRPRAGASHRPRRPEAPAKAPAPPKVGPPGKNGTNR